MLSVPGIFISVVEEWLQSQGYGRSALCQRIKQLKPDATVDLVQAELFLAGAVSISGQKLAALDIGRLVERRHLGALGHMLASAKTLEQMLNGYVFYEGLFYGKNIANVRRNEQGLELYWAIRDLPEHSARFAMSSFASAIEQMGLPRNVISSIAFPFQQENDRHLYHEKIGCDEVFFGRDLGIQFAKSSLQKSLQVDEEITAHISSISTVLPELEDSEFAERLYNEIVSSLPKRQARLSVIAGQMAVSDRTLQRRLMRCEDGLRGVINRIRMHLACEYLKDNSMNLLAVSLLLGYSEQSAFQLAFKQYYGTPPGKWRREHDNSKA